MRIIAHLDMDSFFASVEERGNPQFKGLGIVVGADPKNGFGRGVVSTANYQARKYGIHSAMPISQAFRLSQAALEQGQPKTIFLPVNMSYYAKVSDRIMEIVHKYVPVVEQTSIDEAYLDLSSPAESAEVSLLFCAPPKLVPTVPSGLKHGGRAQKASLPADSTSSCHTWDKAIELIKKIKEEIKSQEKLTASVGIGPNKLIAKIAAGRAKPDGLTVVYPGEVEAFLDPLAIGDIPGIGPKTEEKLHKEKMFKVSDLKKYTREKLLSMFGKLGGDIYDKARGIDNALVETEREAKSISEQETFEKDTLSGSFLIEKLNKMAERVEQRMRNENIKCFKTVTVTVRFFDFETKNRAHSLAEFSDKLSTLRQEALKLFLPFLDRRENPKLKPIRLIGVGIENFSTKQDKAIPTKLTLQL